jgi:1,4-alpha-glucan branching enzyme
MTTAQRTPDQSSSSLFPGAVRYDVGLLTDRDIYLFNEGTHYRLYDKLGAHVQGVEGGSPHSGALRDAGRQGQATGTHFAVWAPDAERVAVMGDFNGWNKESHPLQPYGNSGIWRGCVVGLGKGAIYKYHVQSRYHGYRADKADPFAFATEMPPRTASIVWDLDYAWTDQEWMAGRPRPNGLGSAMAVYEVHLGSWMRVPEEGQRWLTYRELAPKLAGHVKKLGFTHVELMPVMEHPFYGSWGYQVAGYFAPTARYGSPQDLMYLIDVLHHYGIGVILDWVPAHFPTDEHGLGYFDGTHLYEHADAKKGFHPDWNSYIFNYGRNEVRSFLLSNALFWFDKYHADGIRIDAVASMLYLDYSRRDGEWIPNLYGGRENLEAIDLLRRMNEVVYQHHPDVQTIAEESTSWPMVSRPTYVGGLGFGLKWDMGWMHDTLEYMKRDPLYRRYHHNQLTFRMLYAFTENFLLPLSHDEVVHGKGSLLSKMPGDDWQKFANLRLLYGYMYGQPGKKLLFMGDEFAQWNEWNHEGSLDWHLLAYPAHQGVARWVEDLNRLYRTEAALYELDLNPAGFGWITANDSDQSVIAFLRRGKTTGSVVLVACNFTPVPRFQYRLGVPWGGYWHEVLNSDAAEYGGSGLGNDGGVTAGAGASHGRPYSLSLTLPPLATVFLRSES